MKRWIPFVALALIVVLGPAVAEETEEKKGPTEKREKIDTMAREVLAELLDQSEGAKQLKASAYGYAVFSNLKIAFGVSGGGGSGVAVDQGGTRTYMKMGTGGIGFGIGAKRYNVVFLFENQKAFDSFVEKGWQADTQAGVAAGSSGADVASTFKNGVAVYQITDKGLMASADITGTKYWKNKKLN